jgi:alcohol dehydrogenase (cytochrome c)
MHIRFLFTVFLAFAAFQSSAQPLGMSDVSEAELLNPDPSDWLMFSRTFDNQRFSPLDQINRDNVSQLRLVWSRGMYPAINQENIPLVNNGVMYVANPGGIVQALDASNGDLIWQYERDMPLDVEDYIGINRTRTLALYGDKLLYASPDGYVLALGTEGGELHWETLAHDYKLGIEYTTGPMVANGKMITGRNCDDGSDVRETCFIAAHDAETGEEVWRFNVAAGDGEPGSETWGGKSDGSRACAPWGMPASYDPESGLVYWGVANPTPHTRYKRHNGNPFAVPLIAPAELYCNSTIALDVDTGELAWYHQHVPGDDWDADWTQERVLMDSPFDPDPDAVKWINPNIRRGEQRKMVATVGEPGGLTVLDRVTGEFLWAMPFPFDTPFFHVSDIDVETGRTIIDPDMVLTGEDDFHEENCYANTKGYYPMAYHPGENALYIPYHDTCASRRAALNTTNGHTRQTFIRRGADPDHYVGIAKVNMENGRMEVFYSQGIPSNGAVLATAGDLIFWGDMNRRIRAFDAEDGDILWEAVVGGIVQNSTITYSVDGRQYLAILTGDGAAHTSGKLSLVPGLKTARNHNSIYVFALPD